MSDEWDAQRQELFEARLGPLCKVWQEKLGLSYWRLTFEVDEIVDDNPTVDALAVTRRDLGHRATVTFADRVFHYTRERLEEVAVHELVHIILDELARFAMQKMPESDFGWFRGLLEGAVSDLTRVLIDLKNDDG